MWERYGRQKEARQQAQLKSHIDKKLVLTRIPDNIYNTHPYHITVGVRVNDIVKQNYNHVIIYRVDANATKIYCKTFLQLEQIFENHNNRFLEAGYRNFVGSLVDFMMRIPTFVLHSNELNRHEAQTIMTFPQEQGRQQAGYVKYGVDSLLDL